MSNLWPVPIFLGVAVVLSALIAAGRRLFVGTVTARRDFWCPFRNTNVGVDFAESSWDGRLVDVAGCSVFSPPGDVHCDKACLTLKQLPMIKVQAPVPPVGHWVW
jgi:hypothetical protein